jgi:putative ABC transport system permease protein
MSWFHRLFRRAKAEAELNEEIRFYLDQETQLRIDRGESPNEAMQAARRDFGNLTLVKETTRQMWGWRLVEDVARDLRHSLRLLVRSPLFSIVAVLSIGLGVGANSAIFSLVDQALFRQLPVKDPEQLVLLSWNGTFIGYGWGSGDLNSHPFFRELSAENRVFDGVFCRHPTTVYLSVENAPEPVNAEIVSGSYFPVLGVEPALGRLIEESDDLQPGAHPVVVVAYDYWRNRLGGRSDVVGRKLLVNNHPMTVIGVASAGFRGIDWGEVPSLWIPTMMKRQATPEFDWLWDRRGKWLHVFGRLKPGITMQLAEASLQPWFKAMLEADTQREGWPPVTAEQRRLFLASTLRVLPGSQGRSDLRGRLERPLAVLLGATGLVLLLACLNVANLCLARAFSRRRETALRLALGASRGRIVRELLVESGILALGGSALGLLLAPAVTEALISFIRQSITAVDLSSAVNSRVFLFALATAFLTGLLFGLEPALQAGRVDPASAMKAESTAVAGGVRLRKALVIGQIALGMVLLIGAGLFMRTLTNLRAKGPGFPTTNLLTFRVDLGKSGYSPAQAKNRMREMLGAVRSLPEVESAGLGAAGLLKGGSWSQRLTIANGRRVTTDDVVHLNAVSPGFFGSLGASIIRGRDFTEQDAHDRQDSGLLAGFRSAIVNERFARRYFGDRDPIGARLGLGNRPDTRADIEIVGVVKTFSYRGLRATEDQAFFPLFEGGISGGGFYVRTRTRSEAAFSSIRAAVRRVDPSIPITELRTLDDHLDRTLVNERLLAMLASAFAALAILLAVIGLYGVMSFVVSRRTREIGIRLALGASRGTALWLVLRDAAGMVAAGLAIALPAVWGLGRLIENQLFGVRAMDGTTIAGAAALVALVGIGATTLPARRATAVSPMEALRYE